uniref:Uncharacterized protein n=1 Tax=Glossina austeni TaxID=7395 RepID=A0A1A9UMB3_GLOAU
MVASYWFSVYSRAALIFVRMRWPLPAASSGTRKLCIKSHSSTLFNNTATRNYQERNLLMYFKYHLKPNRLLNTNLNINLFTLLDVVKVNIISCNKPTLCRQLKSYNVISDADDGEQISSPTSQHLTLKIFCKLRKQNKTGTAFAKHAIVHIKKLDKDDVIHLNNAQT